MLIPTELNRSLPFTLLAMVLALLLASCNLPGATPTPAPISGDLYVSPSGNDSNNCQSAMDACATIGAAIGKASSGNTIAVLAGTYTEQLVVAKDLDVVGVGPASTILSGGGTGPVITNNQATLNLADIAVQEGSASQGGCIYNDGSLSLVNVTVQFCTADEGGGIFNLGDLLTGNSEIRGNEASDFGGGLYNDSNAVARIDDSNFEGNLVPFQSGNVLNSGGSAIYTLGTTEVTGGTIQNNDGDEAILAVDTSLTFQGVSIRSNKQTALRSSNSNLGNAAMITIEDSSFEDNRFPGASITSGTVQIQNTSFQRNTLYGLNLQSTQASIVDSTFADNGGGTSGDGGGMRVSRGQVDIQNSQFRDNSSPDNGGGLYYDAGTDANSKLTITNSQFQGNEADNGAGLYVESGNIELTGVEVNANSAASSGGGIYASHGETRVAQYSQSFLIQDSAIHGNEATSGNGGGISTRFPEMIVQRSAVYNNTADNGGGGVENGFYLERPEPPFLNLTNVTISGNEADFGGGVSLFSVYTLNHVTIAKNHARTAGGGIGFSRTPPGTSSRTPIFDNNIVAGNTANDPGTENCSSSTNSTGPEQNMEDLDTCGFTIPNTNPMLGPLQNNGGATLTHALGGTSPAIDAATNTNCTSVDQRGISRPQGAACDLGAFELENPPATPTPVATATPQAACQAELTFADASYGSIAYREGQGETLVILDVPAEMEQETYPATINGKSFECTTSPDFPEQLFCVGPRVIEGAEAEMAVFGEGCSQPVFEAEFSVPFPLYPTPTPTPSPTPEVTEIPE